MRSILSLIAIPLLALSASAADKDAWYAKAVKKVEVTFEPAEAKPGQTVTLKLTVYLTDGYHTYPTLQQDKAAAGMVNKITFPEPAELIFVGETFDPKDGKVKAEPALQIDQLRYHTGTVVYERQAVVSPKAAPGTVMVKLPVFSINVCDKDNCFPAKKLTPEAVFKVLDGPAVPVQKAYETEVSKALAGK